MNNPLPPQRMNSSLDAVELERTDPRTRYFSFAYTALTCLIAAAACIKLLFTKPILAGCIYTLLILLCVWSWRYWAKWVRTFGFALLDDGLWVESGVYWRKARFTPRARIQHTEVNQGPIDRRMNLARLSIHTAGVHGEHIHIPGLTLEHAHALRDELLNRAVGRPIAP